MTNIDTFESAFRSADKPVYERKHVDFARILLVTDLLEADAARLLSQVRAFLSVLSDTPEWLALAGSQFSSVGDLLEQIERVAPDLIVTYRHLHSNAWQWPHGLGEYLDVLTQATRVPVMVLPHPEAGHALPHTIDNTDRVMAITDHLTADERLVDYALRFTAEAGTCWLTHIESERQFAHFRAAVEKIPEIESNDVRQLVEAQLLKEPMDYIESCRRAIAAEDAPITIEAIVALNDRVAEYQRLITRHEIDLLVLNTFDGDQFAMHGQAYPLAVELRSVPVLML